MPGNEGPCRNETFVFFGFVSIVELILALVFFVVLFFFFFFFVKNRFCKLQVNETAGAHFCLKNILFYFIFSFFWSNFLSKSLLLIHYVFIFFLFKKENLILKKFPFFTNIFYFLFLFF